MIARGAGRRLIRGVEPGIALKAQVIERNGWSDESKVRLWQPHIAASLTALQEEHKQKGRSLGIIRPDPGSLKFSWKAAEAEDQEDTRGVQASFSMSLCAP